MSPVLIFLGCLVGGIAGDHVVVDDPAGGYNPPPPPPPPVPAPPVGIPAAFGGGGFFPGLGAGFHKNLDIGAGFGPFLGGAFGGGIPPPGPIDGGFPDGGPVFGGGFPPFGLLGPSYIPSTWIGSALGAKGDLLFPIVIFVFFIVGIWTVVQFLLGLIVPLIAAKFSVLNSVTHSALGRRDVSSSGPPGSSPQSNEQLDDLTQTVLDAVEKEQKDPSANTDDNAETVETGSSLW